MRNYEVGDTVEVTLTVTGKHESIDGFYYELSLGNQPFYDTVRARPDQIRSNVTAMYEEMATENARESLFKAQADTEKVFPDDTKTSLLGTKECEKRPFVRNIR